MPKGIEIWHVRCEGCSRTVLYSGVGNELVGAQQRLVCEVCGHRGAQLRRVWHQGKAPAEVRVWKRG